ncbi:MAG: hypothetical protein LC795_23410 [Acidobacteria bacterium]|nr:hypothetical protein [Acidobacteriota bacterium]
MLALLFLVGSALLGACLTRRVTRGALEAWERALWGTVAGWMLAALAAYAAARWQGRLTYGTVVSVTALVWAALALLSAPALARLREARREGGLKGRGLKLRGLFGRRHAGLALVLAASAPVYWRLFSSHTFAPGEGGVYSGGSAWYDLSFHAALANSFLHGENFPAAYTPLAGAPLLYPFLPDFHAAALMASGLSMRAAFLSTALPLALAATGLFYSFALRVTRGAAPAVLATALFLLNGGLGFIEMFRDWRLSGRGLAEFWGALPFNYANDWARAIHWTNLVADTFLPQRAAVYGLPAGLIILTVFAIVWQRWHEGEVKDEGGGVKDERDAERTKDERPSSRPSSFVLRPLFAAGVLAGLLPLFHTHTYVAVGLVSVFLFLMRPRRAWLAFWAPAVLLAAPQLLELARHASGGGVVRWQPGWMGSDAPSFAVYALRNFGVPLLLAAPAWLAAPRAWKTFYLAAVLLLAFALTVVVSPNVFDNGKLTYYWHAVNSVLVARWLVSLARSRRLRLVTAPLAALLALLSVLTGVAALQAESRARARLFTEADLEAARAVRELTPPRALFLTAPAFNHPALTLAGRPVLRGPTAWLWGHGHEFRAREADVRRIYTGSVDAFELLSYYGVDYVYLGGAERDAPGARADFFDLNFHAVYRGAGVAVYDVRRLRAEGAAAPPPRAHTLARPARPRELAGRVGRDPFALLEEFADTSFFVCRIWRAARGRAPSRDEFMPSMQLLGQRLYVGEPGWRRGLEENWREFAVRLAEGDGGRAAALLAAATGPDYDAREYDAAYVLVHFFGYLGRDPDPEGYDFWLGVLTRNGDHRALSRAFMESDEYRGRP